MGPGQLDPFERCKKCVHLKHNHHAETTYEVFANPLMFPKRTDDSRFTSFSGLSGASLLPRKDATKPVA